MTLPILDQPIQTKLSGALHHRIGLVTQIGFIAAKGVMLP